MKAIRMHDYGGPEVLKLEETLEPKVVTGEIMIQVKAAGVNPLDWKIRKGLYQTKYKTTLPAVLGWDVAGVVVSAGSNRFKEGDEVFAMAEIEKGGGYAEFIVMNEQWVSLKPKTLNFKEAAAVPLASLTAWQALFDVAKLQPNQKVLIHAASGGVGSFAVQLAKNKDAYVIATTSSKNLDLVQSLGADEVIDYTHKDFSMHCQEMDVVLDPLGGDVQARSLKCLRKGGVLVTIVGLTTENETLANQLQVQAIPMLVKPNGQTLAQIAQMIDDGKIKPIIDSIVPFNEKEVQNAHRRSEEGHVKGKIVLYW
ncbi:MAG: NADP-dependent oxidoreductase [Candidatus Berkiellales bacterium]